MTAGRFASLRRSCGWAAPASPAGRHGSRAGGLGLGRAVFRVGKVSLAIG